MGYRDSNRSKICRQGTLSIMISCGGILIESKGDNMKVNFEDILKKEKSIKEMVSFNYEERLKISSLPVNENGMVLTKDQAIERTLKRFKSKEFLDFMNK